MAKRLFLGYFIFISFFWYCAGVANLRFLNPGKKNVFALAGDSLDLDCKTSNTSANVLLWVRKRKSDLGNNVPESNRVKLSNQVFKMYNLSLNDGGLYSCKARDSNGENIEKDIGMLIVLQGGYKYPTAHMVMPSKVAEAMSDVNLTCYSFGDAIRHIWFKNGRILPQSQVKLRTSRTNRGLTLQESILLLRQVTPADGGKYVCKVNTSFAPGYQHNATAILQVTTVKPDWKVHDKRYSFYVGDPLKFDCSLTQPWVNVSLWHKVNDNSPYKVLIPGGNLRQSNQTFKIDSVTIHDNGDYQCRAANINPRTIFVHVLTDGIPKPTPKIRRTDWKKIDFGDYVKLQCTAIGQVALKWFKMHVNGTQTRLDSKQRYRTIRSGYKETISDLSIANFGKTDEGQYTCRLTRPYVDWTADAKTYLQMENITKPSFINFPVDKTVEVGSDPYFIYNVKGSPIPTIKWYKVNDDNQEEFLTFCDKGDGGCEAVNETYLAYDIDRSLFQLYSASYPRDNAVFKCVIKNIEGNLSKSFRLTVTAKPEIKNGGSKVSNVEIIHGGTEKTELVCAVKKAIPRNLTYRWEIQPYSNCSSDCLKSSSSWKTLDPSGNFQIISNNHNSTLTIQRYKQTAFIRCTADNGYGRDNRMWKLIMVKKTKQLRALNTTVKTDEKTNVSLSCKADLYVFEQVVWMKNDVDVPRHPRFTVSDRSSSDGMVYTLRIRRANVTDGGTYKCVGTRNDKKEVTVEISLTVQELKVPFVHLKSVVKQQQSSFILQCNVTGHPRPTITWIKDGQQLSRLPTLESKKQCNISESGIYRKEDNQGLGTTLIICKAKYIEHSGWFVCKASNRLGISSGKAFVNVTAQPKISSPEKNEFKVVIGEPFSLFCRSNGNPAPRVWWEKHEEGQKFTQMKNDPANHLNFSAVQTENLGAYRCVAENPFQRVTKEIKIEESNPTLASRAPAPDNSKKYVVVIGCVSFAVLVIVIIVAMVLYKRKKAYGGFYILTLPPLTDYIKKLDPGKPLTEQTNKLPYDAEWEFPRNRLKFYRELGSGAFGKVFLAEGLGIVAFDPRGSIKRRSSKRRFGGSAKRNHYVNNNKVTKVAIKTLKEDSGEAEYKDLLSELKILIHVGEHKNIVNLLGACTKGRESDLWVIIEFCSNGNLLQFLRNRRDIYEPEWRGVSKDPNSQLTMTDLVIAAYQVARGMEFLASRMCIHRDLATRNILLTENYVIKIADFGLARDVGKDSQYVKTSTGLLPIKWMAIEAIIERLFTEKSDVWSFGIVLWELFTLGGTPYPSIQPNEVSEFLVRGNRMDPPHSCPEEIGSMMTTCWHEERNERPSFKELVQMLDKIIEVHTSSEDGCGYLEVQGDEVMNDYLRPSEVKSPQLDPFECNSPLPPIPSPGDNDTDSLLLKDQSGRGQRFNFNKSPKKKAARQDSELEKVRKDGQPEIEKDPDSISRDSDVDGYIDTSLTGKEKERIERELEKDQDSSEDPHLLDNYAYWKKSVV